MSLLLALVAFQATVFDPVKDPAYAKPVTLRLAMLPLKTVVAALAKETGQPLSVSGAVTDWKATMLVRELPAGHAMEALADVLGLVWKRDGSSVILARPEGGAAAESDYLKSERAARQAAAPTAVVSIPGGPVRRRPGRFGGGPRPTDGTRRTAYSRFDPILLAVEGTDTPPPTRLEPAAPTGTDAFSKAVAAWPTVPEGLDPAWSKPITPRALGASSWAGNLYSLADLLSAWHDASGLSVVADAFRVPMAQPNLGLGPTLAVLQSLASNNRVSLRIVDGIARLRHPGFWRLREQEIPESTWITVERSKVPTLDDYAAFASRLTAPQAAAFRSQEAPLSHVPTIPLQDAYPALTLWSALSSQSRRAILAGTPVPLSAVQVASNAYAFALREAPYYHAGDPAGALALPLPQLGLFGTASSGGLDLRLGGERIDGVTYALPR